MDEPGEAPEYIPISYLNAYAYCPRRFYYEFAMAEMVVNEHVLEGQQLHERVDTPGSSKRGDRVQIRRVYLCAPVLRVVGFCDLVEAVPSAECGVRSAESEGVDDLAGLAREGRLYPVEYKKGKIGQWVNDHVQLCAQAMALEEALGAPPGSIGRGYVFYVGSARRDEVALDAGLREQTLAMLAEAREAAVLPHPPPPITNRRKCHDCSLEPICLPREVLHMRSAERGVRNEASTE
ncbi:MAG: CRISPR-associated protein Cas4 [Chloroflexia bacterium]